MTEASLLIDVSAQEWEIVCRILKEHVPEYDVWVFGSRALRKAKKFSDLDIAVITTEPLSLDVTARLREAFSDSELPWKVDIVDWSNIDGSFKKRIEKDKTVVQKGAKKTPPSSRL